MIQERAERNANEWRGGLRRGVWREKHLSAGTGSLVMESQQVKQTCPSDGGAGHRPYYSTALCRRGTVPGIEGGVPPTPRSDPLQRQTDGQMEELRGPFPENRHLLSIPNDPLLAMRNTVCVEWHQLLSGVVELLGVLHINQTANWIWGC
ncbi:hypothetical protein PO909_003096 [Leuciscus waleckii]